MKNKIYKYKLNKIIKINILYKKKKKYFSNHQIILIAIIIKLISKLIKIK